MSRAWYKPQAVPKLLDSFKSSSPCSTRQREVQVWNTTCAVSKSGKSTAMACSVLINPANPQLSGVSKFPYFPLGGPAPKEYPSKDSHHIMGYVTQWGGMEVGGGMLFAANVVDGLVHQLGGWRLAMECRFVKPKPGLHNYNNNEKEEEQQQRCPVGQAVVTGPGGSALQEHFDSIIHTVPPFYHHNHHGENPEQYLLDCYKNALALAFQNGSRVACPLLGAGCRGFPLEIALRLAGTASIRWLRDDQLQQHSSSENNSIGESGGGGDSNKEYLAFAIPDIVIAEQLIDAIQLAETSNNKQS